MTPPTIKDTTRSRSGLRSTIGTRHQGPAFHLQDAIASSGEREIVRDKNRGERVRTMQAFQKLEDHFAGPEVQVSGGLVGQQHGGLADQSRPARPAAALPRKVPRRDVWRALRSPTSSNLASESEAALACGTPRISNGIITFSSAVNSGSR